MNIKRVLVSQHQPEDLQKSPFFELQRKFNLELDFHKFVTVEGLSATEFRKQRINLANYQSVIFTSRMAVDYFFRMAKLMRHEVPEEVKYFCLSEAIGLYLQKYIQFRKRKILSTENDFPELINLMNKYSKSEILFPCSGNLKSAYHHLLDSNGIAYKTAVMFRTVPSKSDHLEIEKYDMLVFFSPVGVESLFKNFPNYKQNGTHITCFGSSTAKAVLDNGLKLQLEAPTPTAPSMTMALEEYLSSRKR